MVKLVVNGKPVEVAAEADTPLLWVLRDKLGLTGTKFGCGIAQCGACTVHVNDQARRSCVLPVGDVAGKPITTIEALGAHGLHAVQAAWLAENVPQCGYCQAGQIMTTVALLRANPQPTDDDIDSALSANLCRCGTYPRIRRAVHRAAKALRSPAADQVGAAAGEASAAGKARPVPVEASSAAGKAGPIPAAASSAGKGRR